MIHNNGQVVKEGLTDAKNNDRWQRADPHEAHGALVKISIPIPSISVSDTFIAKQ